MKPRHQSQPQPQMELSPGQEPTNNWLTRPMPRWARVLVMVVAGWLMLQVASHWRVLHVYQRYFLGNSPAVSVPWERLSSALTEEDVHQLAGQALQCLPDPTAMGNRTCYAPVRAANGHRALTVAFFFRGGRLKTAMVHVPSWAHQEARNALFTRYGGSTPARDGTGVDLTRWKVPNGYVDMNTTRSWLNPLDWSAMVWIPRAV